MADGHSHGTGQPLTTADLPGAFRAPQPSGARRRAVPLPSVGVALAVGAVVLETCGYVLRLSGGTGPLTRVLSMDAPASVPRMYVAALFALAAIVGVAGAARLPGRRSWWMAVSLVAGAIASVKAGGTVHHRAMSALEDAVGTFAALLISIAIAVAVLVGLWTFSRSERRDRRRVIGALAMYALASVGLSEVSGLVPAGWAATATFVEESGEALAAVSFLVAVLVGVAPRLALPAAWPLRRTADAHTLDVADAPARRAAATDH